jgi:predicted ATP-grasp superfamily ATP-dependent carboligase
VRVFVCEFVTGGGLADCPLPACLRREGDIMLRAAVEDLAALPGIEVVTTRDRRLPDPQLPAEVRWLDAARDPWRAWQEILAGADAAWPIAPETGGLLERLSEATLACGCLLLGSRPAAVRLAASKRRTAEHLAVHGVAAVPTWPLPLAGRVPRSVPPRAHGWVVKPDDGAGAQDCYWLRTARDVRRWSDGRSDAARFVIQPCLRGAASSLSLLCNGGACSLLACNGQDVRLEDGRLRYRGVVVGAREALRPVCAALAARIAEAIPQLWGYVGVDFVDTPEGPVVLEVNPRLTASYAGLRAALGVNPAALVLRLLEPGAAPPRVPAPLREHAIATSE